MRNLRLLVEYDGTDYCGFQRQPEAPTIQGVLENRLERLLGEPVRVIGAGRTDAGVHALGQVVNFHTANPIPVDRVPVALNSLLPRGIVVKRAEEAPEGFHARRNARSKRYQYTVLNQEQPSAILGRFCLVQPGPLSAEAMQQALALLVGRHDFSAFQAAGSSARSPVRTVQRAVCRRVGRFVLLVVEADGFLYQMMRIMAAVALEVGTGRRPPEWAGQVLAAGGRVGGPAPPQGLCLMKVRYQPGEPALRKEIGER